MARGQLAEVFRQLRRTAFLSDGAGLTDGQLLECYLTRQEEAAFEALVRRHGPMVLGVCRRVLRNDHDAEDAFQATFLVLIRKASSISPRDKVGNWLYGVAYRTSLKAKAMSAKRRAKERQLAEAPRTEAEESWQELQPLLDRELNRLPGNGDWCWRSSRGPLRTLCEFLQLKITTNLEGNMAEFKPAEVFPPGEFLRDELESRGWSQGDFAEITRRPIQAINEILSGRRRIAPEMARRLGAALGTSAELWMNLQCSASVESGRSRRSG